MRFISKISSWLHGVSESSGLSGFTVINAAGLRKSQGFSYGFEIVTSNGQPLKVEMDEVAAAVSRVIPLLQGKVLRVEGWINPSGSSIRLRKIAAFHQGGI